MAQQQNILSAGAGVPSGALSKQMVVVASRRAMAAGLRAQLAPLGCVVIYARDNSDVLEQLQRYGADVMLGTLRDRQLNGVELCRRIKSNRAYAHTALLLATSSQNPRDFLLGLNAGAAYVMTKPFSAEYCASRILIAAHQCEPPAEPDRAAGRPQPEACSTQCGAQLQYLHAPGMLPSALVHAADRVSDVCFLAKLAMRNRLRQVKAWLPH